MWVASPKEKKAGNCRNEPIRGSLRVNQKYACARRLNHVLLQETRNREALEKLDYNDSSPEIVLRPLYKRRRNKMIKFLNTLREASEPAFLLAIISFIDSLQI